jgi:hypothetical protein
MIDWGAISGFDWDQGNQSKNFEAHGVTQPEAEEVFLNAPIVSEDLRHSSVESRWHALGETNSGKKLHVTFTLRNKGTKIRIISARDMSRKERQTYEKTDS